MIRSTFVRHPREGDTIRGDLRVPDGPPPRSAVVVVHGFKGFKDWGFFPHVCDRLAAAGHAVVSFNFSRNGIGSDPLEFTELDAFGSNTLSLELDELRSILGEVLDGELVPRRPRRVGILGHSRGGGHSILAAAEEPRVAALATWGAVADFERWSDETKAEWRERGRFYVLNSRTGQHMPLDVALLNDFEANRDRLDIGAAAARVEAPWLIVHGTGDLTVPVAEGRALARRAGSARLVLVGDAGHTFEAPHPFESSTPELDQALDATVRHFARHLLEE